MHYNLVRIFQTIQMNAVQVFKTIKSNILSNTNQIDNPDNLLFLDYNIIQKNTGVPDEFSGTGASPKIGVSYGSIIKFFIIAKMVYIDRIFRAEPENDVIFEK